MTCLSEKAFRKLHPEARPPKLKEKEGPILSASGNQLQLKGRYLMPFQIGNQKFSHPVSVLKNLNEDLILGIDFIHTHQLHYDPEQKSFKWKGKDTWQKGLLKVCKAETIEALSTRTVRMQARTESGVIPKPHQPCLVSVSSQEGPFLMGGPYLVKPDDQGCFTIPVTNCAPIDWAVSRNDFLGHVENLEEDELREISPSYLNAVEARMKKEPPRTPLSPQKKKFIMDNLKLDQIPPQFRPRYREVILKHHQAISQHQLDLGQTDTLLHDIELKSAEPVYVKQFKIPEAHQAEVEKHVAEWLRLGVVQPARSKFNSPLFAVAKKNGGIRLVQDFRALNAQTFVDKYSMRDVSECISEIGRSGSSLFTTIDLTAGFWQLLLHPRALPYTAFTVPGKGQFQ